MTDKVQNEQNKQAPATGQKAKENVMAKIGGGLSWWVGSLTGKKKSTTPAVTTVPVEPQPVIPDAAPAPIPVGPTSIPKNEDSVLQDVDSLRKLVGKVSGNVTTKVAPVLKVGVSGTSKAANAFVEKAGPGFITKMLRIFFVLILLIVVAFVAFKLLYKPGNNEGNNNNTTQLTNETTPTPVIYKPPQASIYAEEASVLKLEEDINVITQELGSAVLKESQLTPPTLDFNVVFQ
jgi:hypothetical protein